MHPDVVKMPTDTTPDPTDSPLMAQYLAVKAEHPDALVFFRMGDFYELFFGDAETAARALDIVLTRRGQHRGEDIPMCGVPVHAADAYLARLIRQGFRVAVCEQLEDPAEAKKRGSKAVVRRGVVRVVTAGTLTEDTLLEARATPWLLAVAIEGETVGLAAADVSTGAFRLMACEAGRALAEAMAFAPREVVFHTRDAAHPLVVDLLALTGGIPAPRGGARPGVTQGSEALKRVLEASALDAFGSFAPAELAAAGLLIAYIDLVQAGQAVRLAPPARSTAEDVLVIDPAARLGLELDRGPRGTREGSLLEAVDRTLTPAGARLLAERLARPSQNLNVLSARLDAVAHFCAAPEVLEAVRVTLTRAADITRALTRVELGRAGPRDLAALAAGVEAGRVAVLQAGEAGPLPQELAAAAAAFGPDASPGLWSLVADLVRLVGPSPPTQTKDGGFIAPGVDPVLEELRDLQSGGRQRIAALQADYVSQTCLQALRIKHNNVLGYFIEVGEKAAEALLAPPLNARFRHRQTLASAVRFTTDALIELDQKLSRAGDAALARELELFAALAARVVAEAAGLRACAEGLAVLDVAAGVAHWAREADATRPEIDDSLALHIEGGRHPVVEAALKQARKGFTANDTRLDADGLSAPRLLVVTGPNMAGKSTYLRQTACLVILAQAGLYVPARRMRVGRVDRVFSRIGAADDLARGRSTFMVEMVETATILRQAGPRSLVILDEVGRGTATFDGLAIAWAVLEHLHGENRCRALFATHYHELTGLADSLDAAQNVSLAAKEWKDSLVFLHDVRPGPADRSYGVQVARIAGAPPGVVRRAKAVLARLEAGGAKRETREALPLFAALEAEPELEPAPDAVREVLKGIDPDTLSPREALEALYALKRAAEG